MINPYKSFLAFVPPIHKGLIVLTLILANQAYAQCPLNIDETPTLSNFNNLLIHLPFEGNVDNLGSSIYSASLSGGSFGNGQCGQKLVLDGIDDFVEITPSMDLVNDYTVCAWIEPNNQTDGMGIFSIREQCTNTYRGYSMSQFNLGDYGINTLNNQVDVHQNCTGFSGGDRYTNTGISIPNLAPTFVAMTVTNNSSENRVVTLYVNCEEYSTIMTINFPTSICFNNSINFSTTIGASSPVSPFTSTLDGAIDEVRVYDTALSKDELYDIYRQCLPMQALMTATPSCLGDSATITLINTELDVSYQLMDITNNIAIGASQSGTCGNLAFYTGPHNDTTQFQILATHDTSGCIETIDTIFTIAPSAFYEYGSNQLNYCPGDSVLFNGNYYQTSGIFTDTVINSNSCDSIYTLTISQSSSSYSNDVINSCSPITWVDGNIYTSTNNTATFTTLNSVGCDSIISLDLTVSSSSTGTDSIVACDSLIWINGITYTSSNNTAIHTVQNSVGCDSAISLDLTILNSSTSIDSIFSCTPYTWVDGNTYASSTNSPFHTLTSANGCDSIVNLNLTINPIYTATEAVVACDSFTWLNGITYFNNSIDSIVFQSIYGCDSTITLDLTILTSENLNLGVDTLLCPQETLNLTSNINGNVYVWQDGSNFPSFQVTQAGIYTLSVTSLCGQYTDTIYVDYLEANFDLGNDTTICIGDSITLYTDFIGDTYLWQDSSTSDTLLVTHQGLYWLETSLMGCLWQDSIEVETIDIPEVYIGNDTTMCTGDQLILNAPSNQGAILWSNGSQETSIQVNSPGTYNLSITNSCGNSSDDILISTEECYCELYVPNSFTPDDNSVNDLFYVVFDCPVENYRLEIFDRWGELIFLTNDLNATWDGTINETKKVQSGIYTYKVHIHPVEEVPYIKVGHIGVYY